MLLTRRLPYAAGCPSAVEAGPRVLQSLNRRKQLPLTRGIVIGRIIMVALWAVKISGRGGSSAIVARLRSVRHRESAVQPPSARLL
jgi:hypothetical protein